MSSGVVLRCPNCGTTQAALGECEACHDSDVRYFCPNHEPGRWLDEAACSACGARVGVPPVTARPTPRREPPRDPFREPPRTRPSAGPRSVPPPSSRGEIYPPDDRAPDEEIWSGPVHTPRGGRLEDFGMPGSRGGFSEGPPIIPVALKVISLFGCLRRVVMIIFILIVLAALGFFGMFGFGSMLLHVKQEAPPSRSAHYELVVPRSDLHHHAG